MRALCMVLLFLLLALPASAEEPLAHPTETELGGAIDMVHGPCGHSVGPWRLASVLMSLVPYGTNYPFSAYVVECSGREFEPPLTDHEQLFVWLALYEMDPVFALDNLGHQIDDLGKAPLELKLAALELMAEDFDAADPPERIYRFKDDKELAVRRLADALLEETYIDPYGRGYGEGVDYRGAVYQALFGQFKILGDCRSCTQKRWGTPEEHAWAEMFLALHPDLPAGTALPLAVNHPLLAPWLQVFWTDQDPLRRAQAAVVIWRLAGAKPSADALG